MQHPVVLRVEKHTSMGTIGAAAGHTWRERPTPNADPARTHLNEDWRPARGSKDLRLAIKARLATVTEKLATAKPVLCLEYVITAHHTAFDVHGGHVDHQAYFRDALAWLEAKHGADNIVGLNIQLDEKAPHLVAFVVPLVDVPASTRKRSVIVGTNPDGTKIRETKTYETPAKTRLSAAHYMGSRELLSQMQTDIADQVGSKHDLRRGLKGSTASHVTVQQYYARMKSAEAKHATVTAEAITPAVTKKRLIGKDEMEDLETVAERVTKQVRDTYAPLVAVAGTVQMHALQAESMTDFATKVLSESEGHRLQALKLEQRVSELESLGDYLPENLTLIYQRLVHEAAKEMERQKQQRMDAFDLSIRPSAEQQLKAPNAEPDKTPEMAKRAQIEPEIDENEPDSGPNM